MVRKLATALAAAMVAYLLSLVAFIPPASALSNACGGASYRTGTFAAWQPTTKQNSFFRNCNLDMTVGGGDTANAVAVLQQSLNKCYNQSIDQDGIFGSETKKAVKNAQNAINIFAGGSLVADGTYTFAMANTMLWWVFDGTSQTCHTIISLA